MRTPEAVAEAFCSAWNNADADALTSVFTEDADFINVVGFWWHGHRQIRHNHAIGFRDMFPDTVMVLEKIKVRMLGDAQVALVHARWKMTGQRVPSTTKGAQNKDERGGVRRGMFTFTCEKQSDDTWLAVSGHNTDIVNNVQTHVVDSTGAVNPVRYDAQN